MKIAIMQPYFFPYIGYFQLMNVVDEFVVYDNIKYTKRGWINRNRILVDGKDSYITLPLRKDSDCLDIKDRYVAQSWSIEKKKLLNKIREVYRRAPYCDLTYPVIERCILFEHENLFSFLLNSLLTIRDYLEIQTPLVISSEIPVDRELKMEKRVLGICKARQADNYFNPIGGFTLYDKTDFKRAGVNLHFLRTADFTYRQFDYNFVPFLSIIDVIMFNSMDEVKRYLDTFFILL